MAAPRFDHSQASRCQWWIVVIVGLFTLIFGTIGSLEYEHAQHPDAPLTFSSFLTAAYFAFQMLILHSPHFATGPNGWLEAGRWLGVLTVVSTTWLLVWARLVHEYRLFRLSRWKGHYVICGLGHKGIALLESIKKDRRARVVAIDPSPDPMLVDRCHRAGVGIIRMDATDRCALRMARVERAAEIIIVAFEDETNIRIAAEVRAIRSAAEAPKAFCRVHITGTYLPDALQKWTDASADTHTVLSFFDVYDNEARGILLNLPREDCSPRPRENASAPIDGPGIAANDVRSVHVIVLGMGHMGGALVQRAAKMGHFANGKLLRISVIDRNANQRHERLLLRYPILAEPNEICTIDVHQWEADTFDTRRFIEQSAASPDTILHVFVCLDSNARALELGLRLREVVAVHPEAYISIRIKSKASIAPLLDTAGGRIQAFGMLEDTCPDAILHTGQNEALARSIHEDFVAQHRSDPGREGDTALFDWDLLRDDFRESNRQQADHIAIKLRAVGCRIVDASAPGEAVTEFKREEVELLAELEHRRWNAERWLSGWSSGEKTDKERRIHKYLVGWLELPPEIQEYDRVAVRKIPAVLDRARPRMKVVRV